jgi:uncharacterized membrane protein YidH (DUF202 family)
LIILVIGPLVTWVQNRAHPARSLESYAASCLLTASIVGVPTLAHWLWTSRKSSISQIYYKTTTTLPVVFAVVFVIVLSVVLFVQ